jgi:hypothetical protein
MKAITIKACLFAILIAFGLGRLSNHQPALPDRDVDPGSWKTIALSVPANSDEAAWTDALASHLNAEAEIIEDKADVQVVVLRRSPKGWIVTAEGRLQYSFATHTEVVAFLNVLLQPEDE